MGVELLLQEQPHLVIAFHGGHGLQEGIVEKVKAEEDHEKHRNVFEKLKAVFFKEMIQLGQCFHIIMSKWRNVKMFL